MNPEDFGDWLRKHCAQVGVSLHRLSALCELNEVYFYQSVGRNKGNPPAWVLRRMAPHLHVPFMELMIRAGYVQEKEVREYAERT